MLRANQHTSRQSINPTAHRTSNTLSMGLIDGAALRVICRATSPSHLLSKPHSPIRCCQVPSSNPAPQHHARRVLTWGRGTRSRAMGSVGDMCPRR